MVGSVRKVVWKFQGNWIKTEGGDRKKRPKNVVLRKTRLKIRKPKFSIIFIFMLTFDIPNI